MFDWDDFLSLAERLVVDTTDEAVLRTVISRAYYAVYHAAATFVRTQGLLPTGHSHRAVWRALIHDADANRASVGRQGDRFKQARLEADYRPRFSGDVDRISRGAIAEARAVIEALDRLG